jgi:hypothetical protein
VEESGGRAPTVLISALGGGEWSSVSWRRGEWRQSSSTLDLSIKWRRVVIHVVETWRRVVIHVVETWRRVVIHVVETGGAEAELQHS